MSLCPVTTTLFARDVQECQQANPGWTHGRAVMAVAIGEWGPYASYERKAWARSIRNGPLDPTTDDSRVASFIAAACRAEVLQPPC